MSSSRSPRAVPARNTPPTYFIPGGFDPRWSLLGRALRRRTGDRLRAEALQVALLTGAALAWLVGVYAIEAAATLLALPPLAFGVGLASLGVVIVGAGVLGFRPQAVVRADPQAVTVERGRKRLRLPYASLAQVEVVDARRYHRHHRRYAAVRPFRGDATAPVLLLHARGGERIVALGLRPEDRAALRRQIEERIETRRHAREATRRPMARTGS